jgi:hypothetical protein
MKETAVYSKLLSKKATWAGSIGCVSSDFQVTDNFFAS